MLRLLRKRGVPFLPVMTKTDLLTPDTLACAHTVRTGFEPCDDGNDDDEKEVVPDAIGGSDVEVDEASKKRQVDPRICKGPKPTNYWQETPDYWIWHRKFR